MRKSLHINGYAVQVDIQKTRELYEPLPLVLDEAHCGCEDCRYYAEAIERTSPAIRQVFHQFGIDPRKEGEIWKAAEFDDGIRLYIVDYRFVGEMEGTWQLDDWMEIDEAKFALAYHPVLPIFQSCVPAMLELHAELLIRPEMD